MLAAKHLDPVLGIDVHIIQAPVPGPPVPIPHPFIGMVVDPFDYAPFIGATVMINGMPRAQAGTAGNNIPPHIPMGGVFIQPPGNECEVFMGSATVCIDGDAQSFMGLPVLSCQDVGIIAPPRPKGKVKTRSMVLPTSVVLPIPLGPPVMIGGPPTISLMAMGMRLGMAGLGKGLKRLAKTKLIKKLSKQGKNLKGKFKAKFKRKKTPSHQKSCGRPGEPVDVWTGANVDDFDDFPLPGVPALSWKRYYDSRHAQLDGPIGRGFSHHFQRELRRTSEGFQYISEEREIVDLPQLDDETRSCSADGLELSLIGPGLYRLGESGREDMEFLMPHGSHVAALVAVCLQGERVELVYDENHLLARLNCPEGQSVLLSYDSFGHLRQLHARDHQGNSKLMARYDIDEAGHLLRFIDALTNSASYGYDESSRMSVKTDQNGYSFHYRYTGDGRCVHTYGDDGLYDIKLDYFPEALLTKVTWADDAVFYYIFDLTGTLTEIIDPAGGSQTFELDDDGRVVSETDVAGNVIEYLYDHTGGLSGRLFPTGHILKPLHVQPHQPDPLAYELPATAVEWEWGKKLTPEDKPSVTNSDPVLAAFPVSVDLIAEKLCNPVEEIDALGRVTKSSDATGATFEASYDASGNVVSYSDADGSRHQRQISSWNLVTRESDATRFDKLYAYNLREELTRFTDGAGTLSCFSYDGNDRLTEVFRGGVLKECYAYDAAGSLISKTDAHGDTLYEVKPGPFQLPAEYTLSDGSKVLLQYNERGWPVAGSCSAATIEIDYDVDNLVCRDFRDGKGIEHKTQSGGDRITTLLDQFVIQYLPDDTGGYLVVDPTGEKHQFRTSRSGLYARKFANGSAELAQHDAHGRCVGKWASLSGDPARTWIRRYEFSPGGQLNKVQDSLAGETTYAYDAAHRLVAETRPESDVRHYVYDGANNLTRMADLDLQLGTANQLLSAGGIQFEYNHRQHIARRNDPTESPIEYEYDDRDMLVAVRQADWEWTAEYDALRRRVAKQWDGNRVEYFWDDDRIAAELLNGKQLRIYIYPNIHAWVPFMFVDYDDIQARPDDARRYYIFANQIGVPVRVEDDDGAVVWSGDTEPYSAVEVSSESSISLALRFPGHYHDAEIGLFYNRFRYYDPSIGRYLQSDPLGIAGGDNVYAYPSSPLSKVDLQGQHADSPKSVKGNRKGGADVEGTRKLASVDDFPNPKKLSGMTDEAFEATRRIAKESGDELGKPIRIRMRPANEACLPHIKNGHPKKPVHVKNKTINKTDIDMGPPPRPEDEGLVGHFEPPSEKEALARAEARKGGELTPKEKERLEQRRAQRQQEYADNDGEYRGKKADKVEIDEERGVLKDKKSGKEITGDYDTFDVQEKGPDGEWRSADADTKEKVIDKMKNDPDIDAQHGDHMSWDPKGDRDVGIDQKIKGSHQPDAEKPEPLIDFGSDGSVEKGWYDPNAA